MEYVLDGVIILCFHILTKSFAVYIYILWILCVEDLLEDLVY
jgi:hypothetical protein